MKQYGQASKIKTWSFFSSLFTGFSLTLLTALEFILTNILTPYVHLLIHTLFPIDFYYDTITLINIWRVYLRCFFLCSLSDTIRYQSFITRSTLFGVAEEGNRKLDLFWQKKHRGSFLFGLNTFLDLIEIRKLQNT